MYMSEFKIRDLKERLDKESNKHLKNKMVYMWVKQNHISLSEFEKLLVFVNK